VVRIPGRGDRAPAPSDVIASEDVVHHARRAVAEIDDAAGKDWDEPGNAADRAALTLCRLRRARAGELGGIRHGDEAVRDALRGADAAALAWLASRAIAHMDERGFPETVEPWLE
jgi:hypothetical protein